MPYENIRIQQWTQQRHTILYGTPLLWEHAVAQLVKALRYKPEGSGFDFQ
jgi:hypothetical protein